MIIKFSKDLKKQEYWANGNELAQVMGMDKVGSKRIFSYPENKKKFVWSTKNPVLATDNYRIAQLAPGLRDTMFSLLSSRPRVVEYDGVSVRWDETHVGVWCPSIDTILFARALNKLFSQKKDFKTAIEIGCGSGYLSKFVLAKNKRIRTMNIVDISQYAIKCAMDNIKDARANFFVGDGLSKLRDQKYDLIICNPPYVPRPNSIDDNPYEGVGLLHDLVHNAQKYLNPEGVMLVNVSSLSANLIFKEQPALKMKLLDKMRVPLKVNNIVNNPKWLGYLSKHQGLKREKRKDYEYWQDLFIYKLENE